MKPRIIPLALLRSSGVLITSQCFKPWRSFGTLPQFLKLQVSRQADELIILDLDASLNDSLVSSRTFSLAQSIANIPVAIGGGVKSADIASRYIQQGADKVIVTSLFIDNPQEIKAITDLIGVQSLSLKIDLKWSCDRQNYFVYDHRLGLSTDMCLDDAIGIIERYPVGELILSSVDNDGSMSGADFNFIKHTNSIGIPKIICGGVSSSSDFLDAFKIHDLSGVAASSIFAYTENTPVTIKKELAANGVSTRNI